MNSTPINSHIKSIGELRELEKSITTEFGTNISYEHLTKEQEGLRNIWNKYKKSADVQKDHAEELRSIYSRKIELIEEAEKSAGFSIPLEKNEVEAKKFLKDFEEANKNELEAQKKLEATAKKIEKYHSELNQVAYRYLSLGKLPDKKNPLYNDIILRISIVNSRNYLLFTPAEMREQQVSLSSADFKTLKERVPLPKEELLLLDKIFEPVINNLVAESKKKQGTPPGIFFEHFKDVVDTNPSFAAYLLTKVKFEDVQNVTELLFRRLPPDTIASLAHEFVRYELATCKDPVSFLRSDGVKERLIAKFQEDQTKPVLEEAYQYIRQLYIDKSIELDPARKETTGVADQQDIKMLATSALRRITKTIAEKGMPEPMSKIYRTILNSGFGNEESLIASLLFLRSICPNLQITDQNKPVQQRNSILLNKVLTFIVNKAEPEKEPWMKFIVASPSFVKTSQPAIQEIIQLITKKDLPSQ